MTMKTTKTTKTMPGGAGAGPGALRALALTIPLLLAMAACDDDSSQGNIGPEPPDENPVETCNLDESFLADGGVGRDGIPSIQDPTFVPSNDPNAQYVRDTDRVVGVMVDGQAYAIPHNILWHHEIVNMDVGGEQLAITLCPLTGTSLGFDRRSIGGATLGVSGLLFKSNLIMFNRGEPEGLFPQMLAEARCGEAKGTELARWPVVEMTWAGWQLIHPDTRVVSEDTGEDRNYQQYPYGNYESLENSTFLGFPMPPLDRRRAVKERVVGVPPTDSDPGIAFPFLALEELEGDVQVIEFTYDGEPAILLWADRMRGGMAFRPRTESGQAVTMETSGQIFVDRETGTKFTVDGQGAAGELGGAALDPLESAYVAFWGAWAAFHSGTRLWDGA